ncbi:sulfatase family protein [Pontiella agarivorans]|uniref:Arylsulfatase n=1 Tax=Pontiella agarivorans TaxID=3038953 RepID=A0ABU5N1V9_9BACT|nr:arylsulfatase [Pontiella agarivorans]MDZ8120425.1 arylsulfatase [Pontiella agarivorans]
MKKFLCSALLITSAVSAAPKPNIVLIMADDLGLGDISHHVRTFQNKTPVVETPNIDALAQQGLWFTDGHSATALCSPTRYCVMSGNNNYRSYAPWGVWGTFRETAFRDGEVTLGSVVKTAGYQTGFIGKWHLGGDFLDRKTGELYRGADRDNPESQVDLSRFVGHGPKFCGFDYDFTLPCGIQGPIYLAYENEQWYPIKQDSEIVFMNNENAIHPKDLTSKGFGFGDSNWDTRNIGDLISRKAVDFIDEKAKKDAPFFLYYCSPMVHVPHCPPDEFDGVKVNGATPSRHMDMIVELDLQVKRIVDALKANGVYKNTLLVFTSDNGGLQVDPETMATRHRSNGGWAGCKNSPLEGGHRVPFFALWPGHIQPGVSSEFISNTDMLATFAALVGTPVPKNEAQDSNNLLPLLTHRMDQFVQRDFIVLQAGANNEVIYRKDPWKLIIQSDHHCSFWKPKALYNLEENPTENHKKNLIKNPEYNDLVEKMKQEYLDIRTSGVRTAPYNFQ